MEKTKLYVLTDPDTDEIRYVGITLRKLNERLNGHLSDVRNRPELNHHKINWIKKVLKGGKIPKIVLVKEYETLEEAKQAEIDFIAKYKEEYKLTNATIGGDHLGNRSHSRESILKRDTTRAVVQYNIFGELLETFEITEDAARKLGLTSASKITACCAGRRPHAHGYIWRYEGEELGDISHIDKLSLSFNTLVQFDLKGNIIAEYDSYLTASKAVGDNSKGGNIAAACRGDQITCKGFIWRLVPNFEYKDKSFVPAVVTKPRKAKARTGRKVEQLDMEGNTLGIFNSLSKASEEVLGTPNGRMAIRECCDGVREEYKNYKWRYCPVEE